jgi:CubicO group peptidase (beta-lactamase class C family)
MRTEARWDRTSEETRADVERAQREGRALISISSYAGEGGPRHATVWGAGAPGRDQRFEADVDLEGAPAVLARHAREGYHPAFVGMTGPVDRALLAFVLEPVPAGAPAPRFVPPRPFRDAEGTLFAALAAEGGSIRAGFLRCIAAAGVPRSARGEGLLVAGIWAPQPAVRVAWAVHLDPVQPGEAWRDRWEPRTLETVARPVAAIPITSASGARWVLSLWHDRVIEPWPSPDPFAHARRFEVDEALGPPALARAVERRRAAEDRRVISVGAGGGPSGTSFLALYGSPGREAPLCRRFVVVAAGEEAPASIVADPTTSSDGDEDGAPEHPLDRWVLQHMRATGARQGQLVVVRRRRLCFARAYTYAEAGYPVARLDDAMRLGSVSKAFSAAALLPALERRDVRVDAPVTGPDLLGFGEGEGPPRLAAVTLRHLLTHDAGLKTFADVRPDEPGNPLSEHGLTVMLTGGAGPARPGQMTRGLAALRDDAAFARAPGGSAPLDYSNQGFILLGEILARLARGSFDAYEAAVVDALLRPAGIDPGDRGCLLGAGRTRARARREAPAHPESPTWAEVRFEGDDLDEGPLVLLPYADNGPFLGGAAGWCVPLVWVARVLAALGPTRDGGLWQRRHADLAATRAAPGSHVGHGFHVGEPGFWTFRDGGAGAPPVTIPVTRLHHNGRLDGGSALLVHQIPRDAGDDGLDATLSVALAFSTLGPLYDDIHGKQIFAILRGLEGSRGWGAEDLFERLP